LREERRLGVLRIYGQKRDEVTGGWRGLHDEELHTFAKYNYNDHVREGEMGMSCSTNDGEKNIYRLMEVKPEGKIPLSWVGG
jgi:hypothetical protein